MSAARKVAILIGQSKFPIEEDLLDLSYPHNDVAALKAMLSGTPGEPYDQIHTVLDGTHYDGFHQIDDLVNSLTKDDFVLIYYSGHGLLGRNGRLYLAFENTVQNRMASTSLKVGGLLDVLDNGPARSRLLALDCCYAGAVGAEFSRSGVAEQVQAELRGSGTYVMTAATKVQIAKENPDYGHGIFSKHFIDGLAGAADSTGKGSVTAPELYDYVFSRVTKESAQRPRKFNMEGAGTLTLRKTGLEPHRDKVKDIRHRLFGLAKTEMISSTQLSSALAVIDTRLGKMNGQQRAYFDLLLTSITDDFRPGPFTERWARITKEHTKDPANIIASDPDEQDVSHFHGAPDIGTIEPPPPPPGISERYHNWRKSTWLGTIVHWALVTYGCLIVLGLIVNGGIY